MAIYALLLSLILGSLTFNPAFGQEDEKLCPSFWVEEGLKTQGKLTQKIGDSLGSRAFGSEALNCPAKKSIKELNNTTLLSNFLSSAFNVRPSVEIGQFLTSYSCARNEREMNAQFNLEERKRLISTYYIQMYRLKQKELQAISEIGSIDIILGDEPLAGISQCRDANFIDTHNLCQFLNRNCGLKPDNGAGFDSLVNQTLQALSERFAMVGRIKILALGGGQDFCSLPQFTTKASCSGEWRNSQCILAIKTTKSGCEGISGGVWRSRKEQIEALNQTISALEGVYPWIADNKFTRSYRYASFENIKVALKDYLDNKKITIYEQLKRYRIASACMNGKRPLSQCKSALSTLEDLGHVMGPPQPTGVENQVSDANEYIQRASCQMAHRRTTRDLRHLYTTGILSSLTLGSLKLPGRIATLATLLADTGYAYQSIKQAIKDCSTDQSMRLAGNESPVVAALRLNRPLTTALCPNPAVSYAMTTEVGSVSCVSSAAFAALDLTPLLPHVFRARPKAQDSVPAASSVSPAPRPRVETLSPAQLQLESRARALANKVTYHPRPFEAYEVKKIGTVLSPGSKPKLEDGAHLYVIDTKGRTVIAPRLPQVGGNPEFLSTHPALKAMLGNDAQVAAAGEFQVLNGRIQQINNKSGRWRSGPEHLAFAEERLQVSGLPIEQATRRVDYSTIAVDPVHNSEARMGLRFKEIRSNPAELSLYDEFRARYHSLADKFPGKTPGQFDSSAWIKSKSTDAERNEVFFAAQSLNYVSAEGLESAYLILSKAGMENISRVFRAMN